MIVFSDIQELSHFLRAHTGEYFFITQVTSTTGNLVYEVTNVDEKPIVWEKEVERGCDKASVTYEDEVNKLDVAKRASWADARDIYFD